MVGAAASPAHHGESKCARGHGEMAGEHAAGQRVRRKVARPILVAAEPRPARLFAGVEQRQQIGARAGRGAHHTWHYPPAGREPSRSPRPFPTWHKAKRAPQQCASACSAKAIARLRGISLDDVRAALKLCRGSDNPKGGDDNGAHSRGHRRLGVSAVARHLLSGGPGAGARARACQPPASPRSRSTAPSTARRSPRAFAAGTTRRRTISCSRSRARALPRIAAIWPPPAPRSTASSSSGVLELRDKLGPILWQFPPSTRFDRERLRRFPRAAAAERRGPRAPPRPRDTP